MHRSALLVVATLGLALGAAPAWATPAVAPIFAAKKAASASKKNIAVGQIDGPKGAKLRSTLMLRVKDAGYSVTDAEDLKAGSNKATIAKMAKVLTVDAVVLGKASGNTLTLSIYKADGRRIEQVKLKASSSAKLEIAIEDEFDDIIVAPLAKAAGGKGVIEPKEEPGPAPKEEEAEPESAEDAPPPQEEPPPEEKPEEAEAEAKEEPKQAPRAGRGAVELDLKLRVYSRSFEYTDLVGVRDPNSRRTLRPYNLDFAPAFDFAGIVYPGAFFTDGIASNFGIMGSFVLGIATSTDFEQTIPGTTNKVVTELKTTSQAWDVGVRGRIPIGPAEIALFATYGSQSFILHGDEGGPTGLPPLIPDVKYMFVRLGAEARVRLAKVLIGGHIAPRILTSVRNIDLENVWFPGATGHGLDFGLMLGYGVLPFMDIVLEAAFTGYGFDFNGIPDNPVLAPVVAGGATDRYNSISLGVKFTLGGN
jgi:hypothetical protein